MAQQHQAHGHGCGHRVAAPRPRILSYPAARRAYREWHQRSGLDIKLPSTPHSIEHIVPQRLLRHLPCRPVGDMHNFLLYPARLNSVRSHHRMDDEQHVLALINAVGASCMGSLRVLGLTGHDVDRSDAAENEKQQPRRPLRTKAQRRKAAAGNNVASNADAGHDSGPCLLELPPDHSWSCRISQTFVPPARFKGRIARAVAYMMRQYPQLLAFQHDVLDPYTLVEWHRDHPVSAEEAAAEEFAASMQGIHNHYVTGRLQVDVL